MKRPWAAFALSLVLTAVCSHATADELETPDHRSQARVMTVQAYEVKKVPKTRVYIEAHDKTEAEILAFRRQLIADGAEKVNLFLPAVIVCDIPADIGPAALIQDPAYSYIEEGRLGPSRIAVLSDNMRWAHRGYEMAWQAVHGGSAELVPGDDFQDVVRTVPPEVVRASRDVRRQQRAAGAFAAKLVDQNAEFLIGDILVRMVLPESQGGVEPSKEDWTDEWLNNAISAGASGCLAFQERFAYIPVNFIFEDFRQISTRYEPITHNMETDATWIVDTMASIGYAGYRDELLTVHAFNEDGRARFGTDWVYTAFIANSRNEPGNIFSGAQGGAGYTAYANLGGPYFVIPYPAGSNDPYDLGEVLLFSKIYQHEMVHIFWGLDEYTAAPSQCSSHMGYLDYLNSNKLSLSPDGQTIVGCPNYVPCIMWGAREDDGRPICRFTQGQLGVIDFAPQNDVPDVFDSRPIIEFMNSAVETVTTPEATLNMRVTSLPVPNRNPFQAPENRIDYAAPLKSATLTVGGTNALLRPTDGKWDSTVEDLTFTFTGLTAGLTRVNVTATNVFGLGSVVFQKKLYFIGLNFGQFDFNVRNNAIDVNFNLVGETFGASIDLYRIHDGETELLAEALEGQKQPSSPFTNFSYVDTDVESGEPYQYYVHGHFDITVQGVPFAFETNSNTFDVTAMVPMAKGDFLSQGAPNPFRDRTAISIRVPETRETIITVPDPSSTPHGQGPQLVPTQPVPTSVDVRVYDVKGRFVKQVYQGGLFKQVFTIEWDGTNQNGVAVPSGIYFVKAEAGPQSSTRKVVIVR